MALDLFFVPAKLEYADARDPEFLPNAAQRRARRKVLDAIAAHFDGAQIGEAASEGLVVGFPLGELVAHPGYFHWSLHGAADAAPVAAVVEWFREQGLVCEDPQNAGFGNRERKKGKVQESLNDFDVLAGARLHAIELSEPPLHGLLLSWILADGRLAELAFIHHLRCDVPANVTALIPDRLAAVSVEPGRVQEIGGQRRTMDENYRFTFESGGEVVVQGGVAKSFVAKPAPPSKW